MMAQKLYVLFFIFIYQQMHAYEEQQHRIYSANICIDIS